jgi:hypothetical protein
MINMAQLMCREMYLFAAVAIDIGFVKVFSFDGFIDSYWAVWAFVKQISNVL